MKCMNAYQFPAVSSQGCMNWFEQMLLKWYQKKNLRSLLFVAFQGLISEGSSADIPAGRDPGKEGPERCFFT